MDRKRVSGGKEDGEEVDRAEEKSRMDGCSGEK